MARVLIGNFKGPKGDKGDQGATGPKGEQGIQGPVGPAGGVNSVNGGAGDVVVGGVNLLHNSRELDGWMTSTHVTVEDGTAVISSSGETSNRNYGLRYWIGGGAYAEFAGKTVTVSFEVESDDWDAVTDAAGQSGLDAVVANIELDSGAPGEASTGNMGAYLFARLGSQHFRTVKAVNGEWMKIVSVPLTIDDALWTNDAGKTGTPYDYLVFRFYMRMNGTVRFRKPKLELGTVATDWTPAPEDLTTDLATRAELAVQTIAASNHIIYDDLGQPGIYVQRPPILCKDLVTGGVESVHPAFIVSGKQVKKLMFGKYQGNLKNGRICSLPGEDPSTSINLDNYVKYCRDKGAGHHCMTYAEYAYLALRAKKMKTMPNGNNQWGKDISETVQTAIPTTYETDSVNQKPHLGQPAHVATGTGPITWSDTGDASGIWDLNGNVWEWCAGIRLYKGELQVIQDNDAALPGTDLSATSSAWRAINADATEWSNLYIQPSGDGNTTASVKLDWASDHWDWSKTIANARQPDGKGCRLGKVTVNESVKSLAKMFLQLIALAPEDGATDADYGNDDLYARNDEQEHVCIRGGRWTNGSSAGVFLVDFGNLRSYAGSNFGGRPAFLETEN